MAGGYPSYLDAKKCSPPPRPCCASQSEPAHAMSFERVPACAASLRASDAFSRSVALEWGRSDGATSHSCTPPARIERSTPPGRNAAIEKWAKYKEDFHLRGQSGPKYVRNSLLWGVAFPIVVYTLVKTEQALSTAVTSCAPDNPLPPPTTVSPSAL